MKELFIHQDRVDAEIAARLQGICPFSAFSQAGGRLEITAACRMCGLCVKRGPPGVVVFREQTAAAIDKSLWRGIAVFADTTEGSIHPVTFELLGKARELAAAVVQPVYALLAGSGNQAAAQDLLDYGADEIFVYDDPGLATFLIEPFTAVAADFINRIRPAVLLVGATNAGRSLAPRIAARFRTGLTADCTALEIRPSTDLVQIRPAFGGNIMARIVTPRHRPQLCTVRCKVFAEPCRQARSGGKITRMAWESGHAAGRITVLETIPKESSIDLTEAAAIVAVGRGIKVRKELEPARELAVLLQAQLACTRPLVENGWFDPRLQIGLSGRTVCPRLIITIGISGSVQFVAGMKSADLIIAINSDRAANICSVAHYAVIGDLTEIVPRLVRRIRRSRESAGAAFCSLVSSETEVRP
jgi:electron transfer flavoprotein alpha subunit